jgi:hypothetical protein
LTRLQAKEQGGATVRTVRPLIPEMLPLDAATRGFELPRRKKTFTLLLRPAD